MVRGPPQGTSYILQQNPHFSHVRPQWFTQNQYPSPQPKYGQNFQNYNPYGQNPPGKNIWAQNFSQPCWNPKTGLY